MLVNVRYDIPNDQPPGSAHISGDTNGLKHRHDLYRLRWDKADLASYYGCSSVSELVLNACDDAIASYTNRRYSDIDYQLMVDSIYNDIVTVLNNAAHMYVPRRHKDFYKFWWSEGLKIAKAASVESNNVWKAVGKPRQGPIYDKRNKCRLAYRQLIREEEKREKLTYTNDLHDALLRKDAKRFWNSWRSKFEPSSSCSQVEGCVDENMITDKFAQHFCRSYSYNNKDRADSLYQQYIRARSDYNGSPLLASHSLDTELVSRVIGDMHGGKAPDIVGLTVEHLQHSHPSVVVTLSKLFQLIMLCGRVPSGFHKSYIVPIPKIKDTRTKALTCDDFRGIAISPVISKVFEYCIVDRFSKFLSSSDNQFGFKKSLSCSHAVYSTRLIVDSFVKAGNTANLCSIDLSKAFDKVNHHGLYLKLMKRNVPAELLVIF